MDTEFTGRFQLFSHKLFTQSVNIEIKIDFDNAKNFKSLKNLDISTESINQCPFIPPGLGRRQEADFVYIQLFLTSQFSREDSNRSHRVY